MDKEIQNLVEIKNDEVVTTSKQVSKTFGKAHDKVMRDIRNLTKKDITDIKSMFFEDETTDKYGRPQKQFIMNKNGFALLVMSYTGKRALTFKLEYIKAFDKMEKQLQIDHFMKILNKVKQVEDEDINYHVYLINEKGTSRYKIGISSNVQQRLSQLQIGNANQLSITALSDNVDKATAYHLEVKLHNLLNNKQLTNEWFELSNDDIKLIKFSFDIINN